MRLDGIDGKVALVTGAAGGIGAQVCDRLLAHGALVAGLDLNGTEAPDVLSLAADVTDRSSIDAAFAATERELGQVQLLVLNAGIFIVEPFDETAIANWEQTLAVNLTGPFLCARRALPGMRESQYGRMVSVGSSAGITGGASNCAAYAASKAGLMCLAKSIANEYAGYGITSNAVAPALIDTTMMTEQPTDMAQEIPVGRLGTPGEVADLITYLCSAHAGFITGAVIDINGGFLVH